MVDATSFICMARQPSELDQKLGILLDTDIVVHSFKGGKVRFHALSEGTISCVNTGAVTDTIAVVDDASLFSVARSALFSATIQNEGKEEQLLIGFIVLIDHTITSPNTDTGNIHIRCLFRHRSGGAPTYAQAGYGRREIRVESFAVVEAAAIATVPYAGPFLIPLSYPVLVKRNESILEYLGAFTVINRSTTDYPTFDAHTVATTYTVKVAGYAVLVDVEVIAQYKTLDEFWNEFLAGAL